MSEQHEKAITPRGEDYSQWYLDVIAAADLAEYAPVKGCMIIKPNGYAIWERVQAILDARFKELGVQNAYFPLLIPERLLKREAQHVEGFAPEVAVVTHAGGEKLEEPLIVRPTSETIMYEVFSGWIHSYRDLPLLINQWANVVRWEMKTKPFLRTTEFLWQEGHTVHATEAEADAYARQMLGVYEWFSREYMAIPVITGPKSDNERFAGALRTYSCEAMMQDGKALQYATSHNLGDNFAKAFNIQFLDDQNTPQYGWQTSWGLSTRSIGGLIMTHSDDKGLVIPPRMTNTPVVLVPVFTADNKEEVMTKATELADMISKGTGRLVKIDDRDHLRVGEKFFEWEKRGVPLRIEYGPKDIAAGHCVAVRRDTGEKQTLSVGDDIGGEVKNILENIQSSLYEVAEKRLKENTIKVDGWDDFVSAIENGKFVLAHWDGTTETEKKIKEEIGATIRCIPFTQEQEDGVCVKTGQPSQGRVLFAKAY
ncbi:MAG TPA: proline--tRNA ligase [Candidatus Paceibacterota bacterium]|jgi:prolyl-tRNA synthetase|nr:proline--tRNA ligase [Candidatus Paceibacterota bacterium]